MTRVLIIGGYGNFGRFISTSLAKESALQLIIAGRSSDKAQALTHELNGDGAQHTEAAALDIHDGLSASLQAIKPDIVIHTSGPFQTQGYNVANACII